MEINYEIEVNKEQFEGVLKMVGHSNEEIEEFWAEYAGFFKFEVTPRKYSGSTLNGNLITKIKVSPKENEVILTTDTEDRLFWCKCSDNASADYILCELQRERGVCVSKY